MRSLKEWTYRDMEIYNNQHDRIAWLATATMKEAKQFIVLIGKSRVELRRGRVYKGVVLVDIYLKGYVAV